MPAKRHREKKAFQEEAFQENRFKVRRFNTDTKPLKRSSSNAFPETQYPEAVFESYFPELAANFFTIASTSLRSLSFRLLE